ncbi:MAG: flagellar basal body rod protein FlgB [Arcobacter sp.]|jgi:flagellar basal-body rod protein FlgB|uniref:Flagellar basal body rod protein FlgB n=1 Tax=Arcobacter defluvii TaxID=873191 RepID=A0AAE7BFT6_9BACT|nr:MULTISPECIES: flagellar basal body rod protein FlgB [Arcobacter]MDY3200118.1 flagellar basal body rod protein FlgB [Arcobacter sp.]QKF78491.1 flagellar proximal rod protein FlgB [Arcobacter defluvii]RXI31313.1 flagellar basal body rod protein FlgB [Arcobacter defluvii]BAK74271.1 flagellar basal body rod protein FlgB [Arcobacter sp. L]
MEASSISSTLFNQLNFRGERQKVISSNIANINTPNYKTKDLVFQDELNNALFNNSLQLKQTNSKHLSTVDPLSNNTNPKLVNVQGLEEQNDGNNVNLDSQMSEQAKNKIIFDAIQSSIKRDSRLFRSVVESSAKN